MGEQRLSTGHWRCTFEATPWTNPKMVRFLAWSEFWYNTSFHTTVGLSPFEAVYGHPPATISSYVAGSNNNEAVAIELRHRDDTLQQLKDNLHWAQHHMKELADRHRLDRVYSIGDWVWVKLQPYKQFSVRTHHHHKLHRRYYGPFQVLDRIGVVAYRLELPDSIQLHPVFHVSLLKKFIKNPQTTKYHYLLYQMEPPLFSPLTRFWLLAPCLMKAPPYPKF